MEAKTNEQSRITRDTTALWMGWIGIAAGIISFFFAPLWMSGAAVILGIITLFGRTNSLGWWAIILGIGSMLIRWFYSGTIY